jgi:molecular chaperone GrpE
VSEAPRTPDVPLGADAVEDVTATDETTVAPDGSAVVLDTVSVEEFEQVAEERDAYLDALQRLKAEFDNYRKRVDRDREVQHQAGVRDLVAELLPVIDNLERAVEALGGAGEQIVTGVEMVRGQLAGLLAGRGVEEIAAHAEPFDPTVHEAIAQHPTDEHDEGTVVHVSEKGYRLGELILRPAKVVVAAKPPEEG